MKRTLFIIYLLLQSIIFSQTDNNAAELLRKVMDRLKGRDLSYIVDITQEQKSKPDKSKLFQLWTHWPNDGQIKKKIHAVILKPIEMDGVKYWEFLYHDNKKQEKWTTMPITGKLKNISDRKQKENEFSLSELEITNCMIETHQNSFVGEEMIDGRNTIILESVELKKNGKIDIRKKLWIDPVNNIVLQAKFFNHKGRVLKSISCGEEIYVDSTLFITRIDIKDHKRKQQISVRVSDISLNPNIIPGMFEPHGIE